MINVLDQNVSPDPWNPRRPPGPPPSTPSSMPPIPQPLDAMDEEIEELEEFMVHNAQKPPIYRTTQESNNAKGNNNIVKAPNGIMESVNGYYNDTNIIEDKDDEMEANDNDVKHDGFIGDAIMGSIIDIDDDIIIEGEDPQIREMRQRKRTLSIKLRETVEAFRRLNSTTNGRLTNGWSSSSGGECSEAPTIRHPKLTAKAFSQDSAVESNLMRFESIETRREYMPSRRQTITSKWPSGVRHPKMGLNGSLPSQQRTSNDSQFIDDDEDMPAAILGSRGRRFSVPEKVLIKAHYAILRHEDHQLHFLGAFSRQDEPIKHYMQSITCYDVAPGHSAVCILDAALTVRKAVIAYCTTGLAAALVANTANDDNYDIMTLTDCLHIFRTVAKKPKLAELKLKDFYADHMPYRKKIVYSDSTQTVWDVARMFRINRVHRIPIMHSDPGKFMMDQSNLMYFLSLRQIFSEVIFKIVDSKCVITPNLQALTFKDTQIGTWGNITQLQVHEMTPCGNIIDILLEEKISCVGLINDDGFISGIITKQDIMNTVAERQDAPFTDTLNIPAIKMVSEDCLDFLVTTECTLVNAMRTLYHSSLPCLFIVDNHGEFVLGIVSYADIMDFLLKSIQRSRPKMNSFSHEGLV